jgi:hypothetical protein
MSRSDIPDIDDRVDFCLYVDEFQNFSTDSFADVMSEARKFRLNLIVANQFTTQLTDEIRAAVFGNVGTIVAFRIGQDDTGPLKQYFQPTFDEDDLLRLPTGDTIVRTLVNGVPTAPFSMTTLMPQGHTNPKLGEALKQLSAAKFGRPKAEVDEEITRRVYSVNSSSLNPLMNPNTKINQPSSQSIKPASNSSFLDQWLAKKNQQKPIKPISNTPNSLPASDQNNNLNEDIPVVNNPIAPKNYQQPSSFDNYQSQSSFPLAPDKAQAEEVQNIIQQEPIPKNEGHIDLNSDEKLDHVFHVNND